MWCVGVLASGSVDGEGSSLCGAAGEKAFVVAMLDGVKERILVAICRCEVSVQGCLQPCGRVDRGMIGWRLLSIWVGRTAWCLW